MKTIEDKIRDRLMGSVRVRITSRRRSHSGFYVVYRRGGRVRRVEHFKTRAEAMAWLLQLSGIIAEQVWEVRAAPIKEDTAYAGDLPV